MIETPLLQFEEGSPYRQILIKREDQSLSGSHKFRYFDPRLEELRGKGEKLVVLSTTGNAGITASKIGKARGVEVFCLMSDKGDLNKAEAIRQLGGHVFLSSRPVRFAKYLAKKLGAPLLKTSEDGPEYYESLGEELMAQVPDAEAVVNFATSGTSSLGIMQAHEKAGKKLPELHIVQAGKSCSIAREFLGEEGAEWEEGVGLRDTPRREEVLEWVRKSGGKAWYVLREEYTETQKELIEMNLDTSWEGAACFSVAKQLTLEYPDKKIVVIFSGKNWQDSPAENFQTIDSIEDVDSLIKSA